MGDGVSDGDKRAGGDRSGAPPLREALRRARVEAVERSDVVIGLKHAEIARLEALREALEPVFADLPSEVDIFDVGLVPGERPRLFVDMVAFVEMARDKRTYRFLRDGRHGRAAIAESAELKPIVDAVTAYVARRLVERERLLADDDAFEAPHPAPVAEEATQPALVSEPAETPSPTRGGSTWARVLAVLFAFGVGGAFGAALIIAIMAAAAKGLVPWFI